MAARARQGGGPDPRVLLDQLRAWCILAALLVGGLALLWGCATYHAPPGPAACPQTAQGPCGNGRLGGQP